MIKKQDYMKNIKNSLVNYIFERKGKKKIYFGRKGKKKFNDDCSNKYCCD